MKPSIFRPRTAVLVALILLAAFFRLLPNTRNFAPITAMALLGAAYFDRKRLAFLVPVAAMLLSDLTMEIFERKYSSTDWAGLPILGAVYGTFIVISPWPFGSEAERERLPGRLPSWPFGSDAGRGRLPSWPFGSVAGRGRLPSCARRRSVLCFSL